MWGVFFWGGEALTISGAIFAAIYFESLVFLLTTVSSGTVSFFKVHIQETLSLIVESSFNWCFRLMAIFRFLLIPSSPLGMAFSYYGQPVRIVSCHPNMTWNFQHPNQFSLPYTIQPVIQDSHFLQKQFLWSLTL